jgi:hypothetical protein
MPKSSVAGNARITGTFGAVIFVLLFVEGLTILGVHRLISAHVFVGVLLIPFVAVKLTSTIYRIVRYYTGAAAYVQKGPPNIILRLLGPVVIVTTIAVFASGIAAVLNPGTHWLTSAHKASFIVWFGAMTVHVLGHALETTALAIADLPRATRSEVPGASARLATLLLATAVGVALAVAALGWAHHWQRVH